MTQAPEHAARDELGVKGTGSVLPEIIYGFSPAVIPVASDPRTERTATGYWTLPTPDVRLPELEAFLAGGRPVVSVGFGSMHGHDPDALREVVVGAARRVGVAVVLISGWGALTPGDSADPDVFTIDSVPHSWLFPRVAATVHHGGAGTTGAALAAGVPTIVVPFGADQPFWARRAHELGVSPAPIARTRLTADRLAEAMDTALTNARMEQCASELATVFGEEAGTPTALDIIESAASKQRR
ncbi:MULTISPECIES: glycosyltransferase [unclassified Microbacterium]|uniref:glycosyltransferase n=1 Tax=unclassified Microbacterium TaxID=2609290 RepID=UPI003017A0A2